MSPTLKEQTASDNFDNFAKDTPAKVLVHMGKVVKKFGEEDLVNKLVEESIKNIGDDKRTMRL